MIRRLLVAAVALGAVACDARLPEPESAGAELYATRCGGCHRLYAPGVLTADMWAVTVARMQGVLARHGLRPLDAEERATLLAYLQRHSTGQELP